MLRIKIEFKDGSVEVIQSHTIIDLESELLKIYDIGYSETPLNYIKNIRIWEE